MDSALFEDLCQIRLLLQIELGVVQDGVHAGSLPLASGPAEWSLDDPLLHFLALAVVSGFVAWTAAAVGGIALVVDVSAGLQQEVQALQVTVNSSPCQGRPARGVYGVDCSTTVKKDLDDFSVPCASGLHQGAFGEGPAGALSVLTVDVGARGDEALHCLDVLGVNFLHQRLLQ